MMPPLLLCIVSFFAVWLTVHFFVRFSATRKAKVEPEVGALKPGPVGAVRGVYQIFFILILWALLIFFVPLLLTYKQHSMGSDSKGALFEVVLKALFLPTIFLLLILYGKNRGFLRWIGDGSWPGNEP